MKIRKDFSMSTLRDALSRKSLLVSDGAWGTMLMQRGLRPGECPELWNVGRPGDVKAVAAAYVDAGADIIGANTFGANRLILAQHELADRVVELNRAGARLSKEAAGRSVLVSASMGPTGKFLMTGEVSEEEMYAAFLEQAQALREGSADCCTIETMADPDEAALAIKAVCEAGLEAISTFTYNRMPDGSYRTMMGTSPTEAGRAAADAGASAVGTNCGQGPETMVGIVRELRAALPDVPILVQPNAGMPVEQNGKLTYLETPEAMAALVGALIEAGATIIGGCCGTTPAHIRAIKSAVDTAR
jgi:5-methyltetrahydrofolate--homocysteine methyltransferase